jgi:hypothetical protein
MKKMFWQLGAVVGSVGAMAGVALADGGFDISQATSAITTASTSILAALAAAALIPAGFMGYRYYKKVLGRA